MERDDARLEEQLRLKAQAVGMKKLSDTMKLLEASLAQTEASVNERVEKLRTVHNENNVGLREVHGIVEEIGTFTNKGQQSSSESMNTDAVAKWKAMEQRARNATDNHMEVDAKVKRLGKEKDKNWAPAES